MFPTSKKAKNKKERESKKIRFFFRKKIKNYEAGTVK